MSLCNINSKFNWTRLIIRNALQTCPCRCFASVQKVNVFSNREKVNTSKLAAWNEVFPLVSKVDVNLPLHLEFENNIKEREKFFETYVSKELSLSNVESRRLFFLCQHQLMENYSNNESIIKLCHLLKTYLIEHDVYWNPKILKVPYNLTYNRIKILEELNFIPPYSFSMIDILQDVLQLTPAQTKNLSEYPSGEDSLNSLCKILDYDNTLKSELISYLSKEGYDSIDNISYGELRIICFSYFMSNKYSKISYTRFYNICKRFKIFNESCFLLQKTIVNCLEKDLNIPSNKIFHNALYLFLEHDNLIKIAVNLKGIVGAHLYEAIIKNPLILKAKFDSIVENYHLVKSKCGGKFFTRSIELLLQKPSILKKNFEIIETNADIKEMNLSLLGNDYLAIHLEMILEKIEMLKREEISLKTVPISYIQTPDSHFKEMLDDFTKNSELCVRNYLMKHFNLDYDLIKNKIYVVPNVKTEKFTAFNANKIIEFLITENVPKERIVESIYLIFFDYKLIRQTFLSIAKKFNKNDPCLYAQLFGHLQNITNNNYT